jgi:hypothetical protein
MNMKAPGLQRPTVLSLVESDDGSSDDIHPESGMRVAENAFNTHASNKKVKIATPYGQKTAQAPSKPPLQLLPRRPVTRSMKRAQAPSKPPLQLLPRRPVTRSMKRAQAPSKPPLQPSHP